MRALANPAIEAGRKEFEVSVVLFGTLNRPATKRIVKVLASTGRGAKRIVKSFYPRSSSYEIIGHEQLSSYTPRLI